MATRKSGDGSRGASDGGASPGSYAKIGGSRRRRKGKKGRSSSMPSRPPPSDLAGAAGDDAARDSKSVDEDPRDGEARDDDGLDTAGELVATSEGEPADQVTRPTQPEWGIGLTDETGPASAALSSRALDDARRQASSNRVSRRPLGPLGMDVARSEPPSTHKLDSPAPRLSASAAPRMRVIEINAAESDNTNSSHHQEDAHGSARERSPDAARELAARRASVAPQAQASEGNHLLDAAEVKALADQAAQLLEQGVLGDADSAADDDSDSRYEPDETRPYADPVPRRELSVGTPSQTSGLREIPSLRPHGAFAAQPEALERRSSLLPSSTQLLTLGGRDDDRGEDDPSEALEIDRILNERLRESDLVHPHAMSSVLGARPSMRPSPPPPPDKTSLLWWVVVMFLSAIILAAGVIALREAMEKPPIQAAGSDVAETTPLPAPAVEPSAPPNSPSGVQAGAPSSAPPSAAAPPTATPPVAAGAAVGASAAQDSTRSVSAAKPPPRVEPALPTVQPRPTVTQLPAGRAPVPSAPPAESPAAPAAHARPPRVAPASASQTSQPAPRPTQGDLEEPRLPINPYAE